MINVSRLRSLAGVALAREGCRNGDAWGDMFDDLGNASLPLQVMPRGYAIELYRRRLQVASVVSSDGLDGLAHVVDLLECASDADLAHVLISWHGSGYFLWLDPDANKVIAFWVSRDKRS
ncbi:hypothetical protein [Actinoplanes sp. NPDC049265]|uniref:hypothetical protein n=1 Tax=Actinoplanes sp. NPDC049265 TaxID=3363902 RepID=UPI00371131B2